MRRWRDLGLSSLPLEVIEVADRRLGRAALEMAAKASGDGETEVSVLIPTRTYRRSWGTLLHGKNADRLVRSLGHVPHVNATLVPFNVADVAEGKRALTHPGVWPDLEKPAPPSPAGTPRFATVAGTTPIAALQHRQAARVAGRIHSVRIQPWSGALALECTLTDASGAELLVVFLGRREVAGVRNGTQLVVEGMVGERRGRLAMLNPRYELLSVPESEPDLPA
jgi:hypothetical protein